tara:strand:- start:1025 stop:1315 length:291 start_codon:yes stop_codon:yes gene_type:complete
VTRQTVNECLAAATDSVTLINDINTNGASSSRIDSTSTQAEINECVQQNVDHLETILAYTPDEYIPDKPDIVGYTGDKSSYTGAITTGNAYIAANS